MKKYLTVLFALALASASMAQNNTITGGFAANFGGANYFEGDDDAFVATNDHFRTFGSEGTVTIGYDTDTLIEITKGFSGGYSHAIDVKNTFKSVLTIDSSGGRTLKTNPSGVGDSAVNITSGNGATILIHDGLYTGNEEAAGALINGGGASSTLFLNGASFTGGEATGSKGGSGLNLSNLGRVHINNVAESTLNSTEGGVGFTGFVNSWSSSGSFTVTDTAGDGMTVAASAPLVMATNLYAKGGDGGAITRRYHWNSTTDDSSGGKGFSGTTKLMVNGGAFTGGDGASYTVTPGDGDANTTASMHGGTGLAGSLQDGSLLEFVDVAGGDGGTATIRQDINGAPNFRVNGGAGADVSFTGNTRFDYATFTGGDGGRAEVSGDHSRSSSTANGGTGLNAKGTGAPVLYNSTLQGGQGGSIIISDLKSGTSVSSLGGAGAVGPMQFYSGTVQGGVGGNIRLDGDYNVSGNVSGGDGAQVSGNTMIAGGLFVGGLGGNLELPGNVTSSGGSGIYHTGGTLTISNGVFLGAPGGYAASFNTNGTGSATSIGGSGLRTENGTANIYGGTFSGAAAGVTYSLNETRVHGKGITALNTRLTIDGDAEINGGLQYEVTGTELLSLLRGTVHGNIDILGSGKTILVVSNSFNASTINQTGGTIEVQVGTSEDTLFFDNVKIEDGAFNFVNNMAMLKNANFTLAGTNSTLDFAQGAELDSTHIGADYASISATGGDVVLGERSTIDFMFSDPAAASSNRFVIAAGDFIATNSGAKVTARGISSTPNGYVHLIQAQNVNLGANGIDDVLDVDFGWLTDSTITTNNGVEVNYTYNALSNRTELVRSIPTNLLSRIDTNVLAMSSTEFLKLNNLNKGGGFDLMRYSTTQMPDTISAACKVSEQINQQIAARGTEYRALNGYASSKSNLMPNGAAGPKKDNKNTMKGWVQAFGSRGDQDAGGAFAGYNSQTWGTVIGIDKSFEKLLIGISGGFAGSDLDGGDAYKLETTTYHGSVYSTLGGESLYLDLALTYGMSESKERIAAISSSNKFDSDIFSLYVGGGKMINIKDNWAITPQVSLLSTLFNQEEFNRTGTLIGTTTVGEYDAWSYLGSLGLNLSTAHQIDWLNQGFAMMPELRLHWMHEFNPDPGDFTYTIFGASDSLPVRPRTEDLLRLGVGLDLWHWQYRRSKLELDYDGLFSFDGDYTEHLVSGKVSLKF